MEKIVIESEFITITQFLKITNYISSGGEAKYFLFDNEVFLNKHLVTQRGRKLYHNDQIKIGFNLYKIISHDQKT